MVEKMGRDVYYIFFKIFVIFKNIIKIDKYISYNAI